jgi:hypothetical protein
VKVRPHKFVVTSSRVGRSRLIQVFSPNNGVEPFKKIHVVIEVVLSILVMYTGGGTS